MRKNLNTLFLGVIALSLAAPALLVFGGRLTSSIQQAYKALTMEDRIKALVSKECSQQARQKAWQREHAEWKDKPLTPNWLDDQPRVESDTACVARAMVKYLELEG